MKVMEKLHQDCYMIPKKMIKELGLVTTCVFIHLYNTSLNITSKEFHVTHKQLSEDLCLSDFQISKAIEVLKENNIITATRRGIPSKLFYSITSNGHQYIVMGR